MRVLIWGMSDVQGGIESFILNYINTIRKKDQNIFFDVISLCHPVGEDVILKNNGNCYVITKNKRRYIDNFLRENGRKYDVLWFHCVALSDVVLLKKALRYGIKKIIVHSHTSSMLLNGWRKYYDGVKHSYNRKRVNKFATDFWACSDSAARWMFPPDIYRKKVVIIPNAIDAFKYQFNQEKRQQVRLVNHWDNKLIVACIGRLSREKDPFFALDVFTNLHKICSKSRMIFIGEGQLRDELETKVIQSRMENCVEFMGRRNDVNELLQGIDVVLLTSEVEGFPMVLVEAQASGTCAFAADESVTKQVKLTESVVYLKKKDGSVKWAESINQATIQKKDNFQEFQLSNYDLSSATKYVLSMLRER